MTFLLTKIKNLINSLLCNVVCLNMKLNKRKRNKCNGNGELQTLTILLVVCLCSMIMILIGPQPQRYLSKINIKSNSILLPRVS
jgi:hypothetical protein